MIECAREVSKKVNRDSKLTNDLPTASITWRYFIDWEADTILLNMLNPIEKDVLKYLIRGNLMAK